MQREILVTVDDSRIKILEKKIDDLTKVIFDFIDEKQSIGDWISEEQAGKLTGLGKTKLFELRNQGIVRSSCLTERKIFYKRGDFEKLLNKNEK